jgi:hypothetical protein
MEVSTQPSATLQQLDYNYNHVQLYLCIYTHVTFPITFPMFMCTFNFVKLNAKRTKVSQAAVGDSVELDCVVSKLLPRPSMYIHTNAKYTHVRLN